MQIDVRVRALEDAVLIPLGFAGSKHVPGRLQCGHVARFGARVRHGENDVDTRLGGEPRHGCRADVLDLQCGIAQGTTYPRGLALEQ